MKLQLWTIQEESKIHELSSSGRIICTKNDHSKEWENEYQWMANQMEKRIGKPDVKNQYPIWAWYQYKDKENKRADLRKSGHLPKGTKGIRIEFKKDINEVLLSDFVLWHYPLSYKTFIASDEKELIKFEGKLKQLELDKVNFSELPTEIRNEIIGSWDKIFDLKFEEKYYTNKIDKKMIQACCWEIREEEIVKIDKFIAR